MEGKEVGGCGLVRACVRAFVGWKALGMDEKGFSGDPTMEGPRRSQWSLHRYVAWLPTTTL